MKNKTGRLTELSLLTAAALIIFVIELRFPGIIPVPGIKLGLANIITVFAAYRYTAGETVMVLSVRVFLGAAFAGNMSALIYSVSGAALCLVGILLLVKIIPAENMWLTSAAGAVLHNTGQLFAAAAVMRSAAVFAYFPILVFAGCIAGAFTGICAGIVYGRIAKKQ